MIEVKIFSGDKKPFEKILRIEIFPLSVIAVEQVISLFTMIYAVAALFIANQVILEPQEFDDLRINQHA